MKLCWIIEVVHVALVVVKLKPDFRPEPGIQNQVACSRLSVSGVDRYSVLGTSGIWWKMIGEGALSYFF